MVWVGCRARAQMRLDRCGHWAIQVRMSRAVIGEPYCHARMREAVVTYRGSAPVYLPAEVMEELAGAATTRRETTEVVFARIQAEAKRYARKRPAVRHREWKEKKQ